MGRKWLDNYGQEDNYNDSKISLPKGFVGQGYDISGRNYSPAWEGQFQTGGNIESKWEYSNTNGKLIPQSQLKDSELGYLKDWLISPMAKKIALKREGEAGTDNLDIRLERLNDSNLEISTAEDLLKSTNSYTRRKGEKFNNKNLQGASYTSPSTKYGNIVTRRMAPKNVILHEGAHQSTSGNNLLLKNDVEDILSRVRNDSGSYLSNPTEVHARLNVLRKELKDSGVVDPFKTPVNKEHLNKFLNSYKNPGEISDKPLIEANSGELLNILNSQDDAVWLLNNIVNKNNNSNKLIPIAQNGRNLKRLLNENIKKDSNVYLNYTKKQNINPRREIRKEVDAIQTIQNKYNVSREKAAEIKQKLESEKVIKNPPKSPYEIKPGEDQSFLSKSWEVLTNPATAASYWLNDQRIPDRFSKGERNNLDIATDLFNPFGIVDSAKNAVKETISIPKNLYNGEYREAGSNFLNAGLNTLSVIPALKELKGLKLIEIPKQQFKSKIDWSSINKEISDNAELLKEYYDIERISKANKTWMKNPDGSKFQGTPEEFIKINSQNFKNAFPDGFDYTYRGQSIGTDVPMGGNRGYNSAVFTGDIEQAKTYAINWREPVYKKGLTSSSNNTSSLNKLVYKKTPQDKVFKIDAQGKNWNEIDSPEVFDKLRQLEKEYRIEKGNNLITTDDVADYMERNGYDRVEIDNVIDLSTGISKKSKAIDKTSTTLIHNNKEGRYLKSIIGNNGMFDMTNSNIYKSVLPISLGLGAASQIEQKKEGGVIKDNDGYWNPKNWGKVVEIDSNDITMKGVSQPLLGISDEGDIQYMEPNKNYKFKGKKVREFPIARNGINNLDENSLQQLDQLINFTNYNKLSNGGWLDKF